MRPAPGRGAGAGIRRALVAAAVLGAAAPGAAAFPGGGAAQVVAPPRAAAPVGWIGVSVEVGTAPEAPGGSEDVRIRITGVRAGGPAARAGLQPGDLLLSLNGREPVGGLAEVLGSLTPGDTVAVAVLRDGRQHTVVVRAGARPAALPAPEARWVLVRADTLAEHMFRAMDSLRARIRTVDGNRRLRAVVADAPPTPGTPGTPGPGIPGTPDRSFRPLRPGDTLAWHAAPVPFPGTAAEAAAPPGRAGAPERAAAVTLRPLAPYALGRNRAAGAEVVELKPGLAAYFDVEGGVLVVDVAPGTPAARAGIRAGDVLTRVGATEVTSVAQVRASLAEPRDSLRVRLVRKGATLELLLRR